MSNVQSRPLIKVIRRVLTCASFSVSALAGGAAWAADAGLQSVTNALAAVRQHPGVNRERDAGPELTGVKRALRAWLEPDLAQLPTNSNPPDEADRLSRGLSSELETAGLTCGDKPAGPCQPKDTSDFDARGYVGGVRVSYLDYGRYLLVTTEVGVRCGYDQSAYIYGRLSGAWALFFASEQDDYGANYAPQNLFEVEVSPSQVAWDQPAPPPLVLALGYSPWCQSNWQALYTRLWRVAASNPSPPALIQRVDSLYMGDDPAVAEGSVTTNDVVIEWRGQSADSGILIRPHVLHYLVGEADRTERIDPVALDPADFVDEWLNSPWREAGAWTAPARKTALAAWHNRLRQGDLVLGDFDGPALRCRADASLWQVGFAAQLGTVDHPRQDVTAYYLVRWTAPYRFSLVNVGPKPNHNCDMRVAMPDNLGTLFPLQGWRDRAVTEPPPNSR